MPTREELRAAWEKEFQLALELDTWGQVEEAKEGYERVAAKILAGESNASLGLSASEKTILAKLAATLGLRAREIGQNHSRDLGEDGMRTLAPVFKQILVDPSAKLPYEVPGLAAMVSSAKRGGLEGMGGPAGVISDGSPYDTGGGEGYAQGEEGGTLLPPPLLPHAGDEGLIIRIERMGFKDSNEFINAHITVAVTDDQGRLLETPQDTPMTNQRKPSYVLFGCDVHVQTPLNRMKTGVSIFFEFKHFKPKKRKVSTKAWAVIELDEIQTALRSDPSAEFKDVALEIYKKPTDFTKKRVTLLSVKPLYLHLRLSRRTN
mmetsp:Transcript_1177/g.4414  ORF Transcript_1177/g.4414 Transcript_1177/m.4414 type:complete len:319 (-) Transcript_1177:1068-2024(-)